MCVSAVMAKAERDMNAGDGANAWTEAKKAKATERRIVGTKNVDGVAAGTMQSATAAGRSEPKEQDTIARQQIVKRYTLDRTKTRRNYQIRIGECALIHLCYGKTEPITTFKNAEAMVIWSSYLS